MMGSNEEEIDVDPDYKRNNEALRNISKKDQEENKVNLEKVTKILKDEFDKELHIRQKQLEEIEEKVTKAQKLLHIVRYVLVSSYYNKKSLELSAGSDETTNNIFDSQSRIHPALKKLIGKNANLEVITALGKRKAVLKSCDTSEPSTSQAGTSKKIKQEIKQEQPQPLDDNQNCLENRKKTQHRLIIGNISKYMPSLEDDNTTHKWMVYVRGEKDKPDVSHIVEKVRFYLHPSYKPHDVIEVNESPFHLSRRGWGEFPLRVQVVFRCKLNKPIEIVHNLKLDKTCSGRQMLGNETLIDVYLHEDLPSPIKLEAPGPSKAAIEPFTIDHDVDSIESPDMDFSVPDGFDTTFDSLELGLDISSQEHDYCQENEEATEEDDTIRFDHSYCIPRNGESSASKVEAAEGVTSSNDVLDTKLMYGLDDTYLAGNVTTSEKKAQTSTLVKPQPQQILINQPIKILLPINNKAILTNGHILSTSSPIVIKKFVPTTTSTRYTIKLPQNKFKNMGEILPYVIKRMPLWSERARDADFKRSFPFMATSREEFSSWNVGKRVNAEWCRARMIKKLLDLNFSPIAKKWTTKTYFMYARSHLFSPIVSFNIFRVQSQDVYLIDNCFRDSLKKYSSTSNAPSVDVNIDVESDSGLLGCAASPVVDISDPAWAPHCSFVKEAALDCGIVLKPVEVVEGVIFNGAERMILEAVKCFAENLIRRGHHHMVTSEKYVVGMSKVGVKDIQMALNERPEIQSIKDFKRRRQEMYFFS